MTARGARSGIHVVAAIALSALPVPAQGPAQGPAQEPAPKPPAAPDSKKEEEPSLFVDEQDGWFDISKFLETKAGFFPLFMPITEPAVGFGLAGGLVFFDAPPQVIHTEDGTRVLPPNTTFVGGMATENESWAGFGGHLHKFDDGRIRYLVGGGYADLNLDWFGQGNTSSDKSISYNIEAAAVMQKLTFKLGDSDFFLGPTQRFLSTRSSFDSATLPPDVPRNELESTISGLGFSLGYDTRNSFFCPTYGMKASLDYTQNDHAIGSDFDYGRLGLEACGYLPLGGPFSIGLRGEGEYAGSEAPFFDLGSVNLRGIPAGRYVDNYAFTLEAELRWDVTERWTLLGFGGTGFVADELHDLDHSQGVGAGGLGFRYLIARTFDLRLGLDVAAGPEDQAIYVSVGTGWLRD